MVTSPTSCAGENFFGWVIINSDDGNIWPTPIWHYRQKTLMDQAIEGYWTGPVPAWHRHC